MISVFADTLFWVAVINPLDQWHERAVGAERRLQGWRFVTTEPVLLEVLNYFSGYGPESREYSVRIVYLLLERADVLTLEQTHDTFIEGMALFRNRPDKGYSLTDCISMNAMRSLGVTEVLTHDRHFTQEGFSILL